MPHDHAAYMKNWRKENPASVAKTEAGRDVVARRVQTRKSYSKNKNGINQRRRSGYAVNPAKVLDAQKLRPSYRSEASQDRRYKRDYGVSRDAVISLLKSQENGCAVCTTPLRIDPRLSRAHPEKGHVDHCHETKKVRGVLCNKCNLALGYLRDNAIIAKAAEAYLLLHKP